MKELMGTGVALCTPFNIDGSVDYSSLEKLVEYNIQGGVEYLVVLGTTAETVTLSKEEKKSVVECIQDVTVSRLPIVLGAGGNNTQLVSQEIQNISKKEFAAILSVSPAYNKPNQEGIYAHYQYLAKNNPDAKIIMYNVPSRTGSNIQPETTLRLANDYPNLVAIKDAPLVFRQYLDLLKDVPEGFKVISGDDVFALAAVLGGGSGVISVIGQALPEEFSQMIRNGLQEKASLSYPILYRILPLIDLIFKEGNPSGIKAMLKLKGIITNDTVRLPLTHASKKLNIAIETELKKQLISMT